MNYTEALEYIHKVSWRGSRPGLERITELCELLSNPQDESEFVHVAGTNGKGSFCSMLSSILISAGYKVGTFTSPYITRFNDRMAINGKEIGDDELASLVEEVMPLAESMADKPTEFELISAIGFLWFRRNNCDIVVLEAGMGGRFDSTNVIKKSKLSVITGIDYDHMALLGDTLEKIAWEKAGIIKAGCPVLTGGMDSSPLEVIKTEAEKKHSPFGTVNYSLLNVKEQTLDGTVFDCKDHKNLKIRLLGSYQKYNAALAVEAADTLGIDEKYIREGLINAVWHARFELLSVDPTVIYDGGHNIQGVNACVESIKLYFKTGVNLVTGVMKDKTYEQMAEIFSGVAVSAVTLTPDNPRALPAEEYAKVFASLSVPAIPAEDEKDAIEKALALQRENGCPIVCAGSLYMYEKLSKEIKNAVSGKK